MKARTLIALLTLCSALPACVPVVATGVGMGVAATMDRRTYGVQVEDTSIETRLSSRISEKLGDSAQVWVTSYNRIVLMIGRVPNEQAKATAEQLISSLPNEVRGVHNELTVGPKQSLGAQSEDTFTTSKVKTRLLESSEVSGNKIKVVTDSGTVYLMGMLTNEEARVASTITSTTTGVRKVVKLFEIVTPEQAQVLDHPAGTESNDGKKNAPPAR